MPGSQGLSRRLTLGPAVALVIGQVIAVGIFLTPGTMLRTLASPAWALGVWVLMGAMGICGALCYGALAARFPLAGGGYVYLREAYGPRVAFLYGWKCLLIMDPGITAALATGAAAYVGFIVPIGPAAARLVAIGAIALFALVHVAGVGPGARLLTTITLLKIALIGGLVALAAAHSGGSWEHFRPFVGRRPGAPPFAGALAGALVAAFFSFGGWWEITKMAGEVRDARRTLARALWLGLVAVTFVYIAATLAFIYTVPIEQVGSGDAFVAQVGTALLGNAGGIAVAAVVLVCVLGSLGAILMFAPRLYFAMAQDGLFPAAAAALSPRFGTPVFAIVIQAVLASILVLLGTFDTIVSYFVFITVVFIALTVASVFVIRKRDPAFAVPGYPWTPLVFLGIVALLLVLLALNNPLQASLGAAVVAAGVPVYHLVYARRASAARLKESAI
jgi:APA family basic amino acid/polyamine antiporter